MEAILKIAGPGQRGAVEAILEREGEKLQWLFTANISYIGDSIKLLNESELVREEVLRSVHSTGSFYESLISLSRVRQLSSDKGLDISQRQDLHHLIASAAYYMTAPHRTSGKSGKPEFYPDFSFRIDDGVPTVIPSEYPLPGVYQKLFSEDYALIRAGSEGRVIDISKVYSSGDVAERAQSIASELKGALGDDPDAVIAIALQMSLDGNRGENMECVIKELTALIEADGDLKGSEPDED